MSIWQGSPPTAISYSVGTWAATGGAATFPAVVSDASDSSWEAKTATTTANDYIQCLTALPAIPANEVIVQIRSRAKVTRPTSGASIVISLIKRATTSDGGVTDTTLTSSAYTGTASLVTLTGSWSAV
jgi:hypothetical protein